MGRLLGEEEALEFLATRGVLLTTSESYKNWRQRAGVATVPAVVDEDDLRRAIEEKERKRGADNGGFDRPS